MGTVSVEKHEHTRGVGARKVKEKREGKVRVNCAGQGDIKRGADAKT